jgi:acyl-CoA synthetase (AMP-forming)/AMP-acid ligase II
VLGYYGNIKANKKAFPIGEEWFDTGDLGYICPAVKGSRMAGQVDPFCVALRCVVLCCVMLHCIC